MIIVWEEERCNVCGRVLDLQDINYVEDYDYVLGWVGCPICGYAYGRVLVVKNGVLEVEK